MIWDLHFLKNHAFLKLVCYKPRLSLHAVITTVTAQKESQGWFPIIRLQSGSNGFSG